MAEYVFLAITKDGKEKKGVMDVSDENKVASVLRKDGLIPVRIATAGTLDKSISFGGHVSSRDLGVFCRQFQSILKAGVQIIEALKMLGEQTANKAFKKAILETADAVEKGETLANAMRLNSKIFPSILINLVEAGEASGSLETSFGRMAEHFEKSARTQAMVKKAMIYPIAVVIVAVAVVIIMSIVVFPKFAAMFADMGSKLPLITRIVMAISNALMYRWYALIIAAVIIVVAFKWFSSTDYGRHVLGKVSISVPVFGKMNVKSASASFSRTLSTLVSSGMGIPEALEITSKAMDNYLYKDALMEAKKEVEQGMPLSDPLVRCGLFPTMVVQMLKIGENTGNVEPMLNKVAEYYEEEVETQTAGLSAAMEPIIIVVLGGIVACLVLAMYLPMINMYSGLENL